VLTVVHFAASRFYGGPERQMLGLAEHLTNWRTVFASFAEDGCCREFLKVASDRGFEAFGLVNDTPKLWAACREVRSILRRTSARMLICHGYKANLIGRIAAAQEKIPVIAVSRGWTGASFKVRRFEALDRRVLHWMDRVVCVSQAQAVKMRQAGVAADRVIVIRNAIDTRRFQCRDVGYRARLLAMFESPPRIIVGAAGRLSPEKGFDVLIRAAARVAESDRSIGFLLFGEGLLRSQLERQIAVARLQDRVKLVGFHAELDQYFPHFDILALPSFTEGLPNVVLEAFAAGVSVVATAVGGVPEVVDDGISGYLVPPGDDAALADRLVQVAGIKSLHKAMGTHGRCRVEREFSFVAQAKAYEELFFQQLGSTIEPNRSLSSNENDVFTHSGR
jgi:glycosyltransferase involved in cell wall biosynthesis